MSVQENIRESARQTARENLAAWHGEIALAEELALLQTTSIAAQLATDTTDIDAYRLEAAELIGEALSTSRAVRAQQLSERIAFSRALAGATAQNEPKAASAATPQVLPRIAMLSSPIFTDAVVAFFPNTAIGEPIFAHSFADVSEEVATGRAAFGILPLEDSTEGKLFRIYEQIEHFELHIACVADIRGEEGKTVRMALVYKNEPPTLSDDGDRVLEILPYGDEHALGDLLTVAAAFGLSLRRVDSLPLSYREDGFMQHLVLRAEHGDMRGFFTYLGLFMPRTIITADYINIKTRDQI